MIAKKYRLTEKEVKKVLRERKAFFSHNIIANVLPNTCGHNRIGIILSGKAAPGSVNRNGLRRSIYEYSRCSLQNGSFDVVFFGKKGVVFKKETSKYIEKDITSILQSLGKK